MATPRSSIPRKDPFLSGHHVDYGNRVPNHVGDACYTQDSQATDDRRDIACDTDNDVTCYGCYSHRRIDPPVLQDAMATYNYIDYTQRLEEPLRGDSTLLGDSTEYTDTEGNRDSGFGSQGIPSRLTPSPRIGDTSRIGDSEVRHDPFLGRGQAMVLNDISNQSRRRNSLLLNHSRTIPRTRMKWSSDAGKSRFRRTSFWPRAIWNSLCSRSKRQDSMICCSSRKQRWCRHLCAFLRRIPRRVFRVLQWCYGRNQQHSMCFGLCDLYSLVLSAIILVMIVRERMTKYCTAVRYSNDRFCSERYMSFECNFNDRDFLEDDELFTRCGVFGGQIIQHQTNNTIETMCGPNTPLMGSLKMTKKQESEEISKLYKVPNIVHYTLDCNESMRFDYINYLSVVSVEKFIAPDRIYIHCNCFLDTDWWFQMLEEVKDVYVVRREFPEYIQAREPRWIHDRSDVMKLQTLFHNGGIHLDLDALVIRPLTKLRSHDFVVGRQGGDQLLNDGVLLSKPHSPMVCLWMNGYRQYDPWPWQHSLYSLGHLEKIVEKFPKQVHVVRNHLLGPGPRDIKTELYEGDYNWSVNFAVKLWHDRVNGVRMPTNAEEARNTSGAFGELLRHCSKEFKITTTTTTTTKAPRKKKKIKRTPNKNLNSKKKKVQAKH